MGQHGHAGFQHAARPGPTFFEEVNTTVQEEPNSAENAEILGLLAQSVSRRASLSRPMPG